MSEKRSAYRLPPCPAYDVEGMESWLSDLSAEGLELERDGFFLGIASFRRVETPRRLRYRLEAAPNSGKFLEDDNSTPQQEALELSEALGWEFITRRGDFFIYAAPEDGTRELNTDPRVQALALDMVRKRQKGAIFRCVFWGILYPLLISRIPPALALLYLPTALVILSPILLIWMLAGAIHEARHLKRLRQKLQEGIGLDHGTDWKQRAQRHHIRRGLCAGLWILWVCLLLQFVGLSITEEDHIPLAEYNAEVPFATLEDMTVYPAEHRENSILSSTVREWTTLLAAKNYDWNELGYITGPDGIGFEGTFYVEYHETAAAWLAWLAAQEYHQHDKWDYSPLFHESNYEAIELPELQADLAIAYYNQYHATTVVLQQDNIVMRAVIFPHRSDTPLYSLKDWVRVMDAKLAEAVK